MIWELLASEQAPAGGQGDLSMKPSAKDTVTGKKGSSWGDFGLALITLAAPQLLSVGPGRLVWGKEYWPSAQRRREGKGGPRQETPGLMNFNEQRKATFIAHQ